MQSEEEFSKQSSQMESAQFKLTWANPYENNSFQDKRVFLPFHTIAYSTLMRAGNGKAT